MPAVSRNTNHKNNSKSALLNQRIIDPRPFAIARSLAKERARRVNCNEEGTPNSSSSTSSSYIRRPATLSGRRIVPLKRQKYNPQLVENARRRLERMKSASDRGESEDERAIGQLCNSISTTTIRGRVPAPPPQPPWVRPALPPIDPALAPTVPATPVERLSQTASPILPPSKLANTTVSPIPVLAEATSILLGRLSSDERADYVVEDSEPFGVPESNGETMTSQTQTHSNTFDATWTYEDPIATGVVPPSSASSANAHLNARTEFFPLSQADTFTANEESFIPSAIAQAPPPEAVYVQDTPTPLAHSSVHSLLSRMGPQSQAQVPSSTTPAFASAFINPGGPSSALSTSNPTFSNLGSSPPASAPPASDSGFAFTGSGMATSSSYPGTGSFASSSAGNGGFAFAFVAAAAPLPTVEVEIDTQDTLVPAVPSLLSRMGPQAHASAPAFPSTGTTPTTAPASAFVNPPHHDASGSSFFGFGLGPGSATSASASASNSTFSNSNTYTTFSVPYSSFSASTSTGSWNSGDSDQVNTGASIGTGTGSGFSFSSGGTQTAWKLGLNNSAGQYKAAASDVWSSGSNGNGNGNGTGSGSLASSSNAFNPGWYDNAFVTSTNTAFDGSSFNNTGSQANTSSAFNTNNLNTAANFRSDPGGSTFINLFSSFDAWSNNSNKNDNNNTTWSNPAPSTYAGSNNNTACPSYSSGTDGNGFATFNSGTNIPYPSSSTQEPLPDGDVEMMDAPSVVFEASAREISSAIPVNKDPWQNMSLPSFQSTRHPIPQTNPWQNMTQPSFHSTQYTSPQTVNPWQNMTLPTFSVPSQPSPWKNTSPYPPPEPQVAPEHVQADMKRNEYSIPCRQRSSRPPYESVTTELHPLDDWLKETRASLPRQRPTAATWFYGPLPRLPLPSELEPSSPPAKRRLRNIDGEKWREIMEGKPTPEMASTDHHRSTTRPSTTRKRCPASAQVPRPPSAAPCQSAPSYGPSSVVDYILPCVTSTLDRAIHHVTRYQLWT